MEDTGFLPLSRSDLNEFHGRICYQLAEILNSVRETLRKQHYCDFTGLKATAWLLGYGFYFRMHDFGCRLYFSAQDWCNSEIRTPYWLHVKTPDWNPDTGISDVLKASDMFRETTVSDVFRSVLAKSPRCSVVNLLTSPLFLMISCANQPPMPLVNFCRIGYID